MKTTTTLVSILLIATTALKAQEQPEKKWYVKPYASYFFSLTPVEYPSIGGMPSRDRVFTVNPVTGQQATQSEDIMTGSFGAGYRIGLVGGYQFNNVLGLEMAFNYYKSNTQDMSKQNGTFTGTGSPMDGTTALSMEATGQVTAFDIAPALVLYIPNQSQTFKPYAKVGVIIPVSGYSENVTKITDNTGSVAVSQGLLTTEMRAAITQAAIQQYTNAGFPYQTPNVQMLLSGVERVDRTRSKPTVGFQSALGADFLLSKTLSINIEVEYRNVTVSSKKREMQSVSGSYVVIDRNNNNPSTSAPFVLGQGTLSKDAASEASKTINYHDHINVNEHNIVASGQFDPNRPADEVSNRLTFGGLGVSLGFKFRF
ncbi:outer membrane beta-barrel protein [Olivibacter sitiensis]|uniref:outer membrane beta-barrel protein n=1 Tax=Olivibacter sitiensis TaxID=376470 RepID=UPI00041532DD|nr:outer membrane beta-barrel protein [Olivibacter sitiensis]